MSSDTDELSRDELFEVLSSDRRRCLIYYLEAEGGEADLRELARRIAAWENEIEPEEVSEEGRKRVYISLYQSHVPKLEESGLIRYDNDTKTVSSTERIRDVTELFAEQTRPWGRYYLALAGGSLFLLVLHLLDIAITSGTVLVVLVVGALLALSLAHYYVEHWSSSQTPLAELL